MRVKAETATEGGWRFMAARRKCEEDSWISLVMKLEARRKYEKTARLRQEKREAQVMRLGTLFYRTGKRKISETHRLT